MAADRRSEGMWKLLRFMKSATEVLATAGAVLAAAIVVVETYQALRKKMDAEPRAPSPLAGRSRHAETDT